MSLTAGELPQILRERIPDTANDDQDGADVYSDLAPKPLTEPVAEEAAHDGGEEEGGGDDAEEETGGSAKVARMSMTSWNRRDMKV